MSYTAAQRGPLSPPKPSALEAFRVAGWIHGLSGLIERFPGAWTALGDLETRLLEDLIADIDIERPAYVTGLARAGSTILLEFLASHPDAVTHRYRDFPPVLTPYMWNRWLDRVPRRAETRQQRAHGDGIEVGPESPEAFEEVLWMRFFPHQHDPSRSAVLGRDTRNPRFEAFYRDHIRKLLALRGPGRYVAKGNYNVTRLAYLQEIFPDARFVLPVRDPVWHIASLIKQQMLFSAAARRYPRSRHHLKRTGHFEFGLDRRAIHVGDDEAAVEIAGQWRQGAEIAGWARYWASIYGYLSETLAEDPRLREACLVVRFEDLCLSPRETLGRVLEHVGLPVHEDHLEGAVRRMRFPDYYRPVFTARQLTIIDRLAGAVARSYGYETAPDPGE